MVKCANSIVIYYIFLDPDVKPFIIVSISNNLVLTIITLFCLALLAIRQEIKIRVLNSKSEDLNQRKD
ncbi:hypothetical protein SF1_28340 [Sphingobacterium faecium NBRC 15299]|nr:hypothetical protein SF1_28340 [Sphingobacterium faecium NBRC 15299]